MTTKKMVMVLCSLLAAGTLLPMAQAAHYTLYNEPIAMHEEFGVYEDSTQIDDANNKNGPAVDDKRAVPSDGDVPARFRGLSDTLKNTGATNTLGARGDLILDHMMFGSGVEAGQLVPYGYFVSNAGGQPRTTPTSMHALWYGFWDDVNGDGIIDEFDCADTASNCAPRDEFVWRGAGSGETFQGNAWFLPGDYDGSIGSGGHVEPSAIAGDCSRYGADNSGCVSPAKDMPYADSTSQDPTNLNNKRWAGNNGGGQWTPEEFLVVSQHIISIVGPNGLVENSDYNFKVECTLADDCMRDYDWYQALAGEAVDNLYLSTLRGPRDSVWAPNEQATAQIILAPCPRTPTDAVCGQDTRHLDAVQPSGASLAAYANLIVDSVVGAYTNSPPRTIDTPAGPVSVGAQGFYGDLLVMNGNNGVNSANANTGVFFRPAMTAWNWDDTSADGYIGKPLPTEASLYEQGLASTPNNGACERGGGVFCELIFRADVFTETVAITAAGGWPPGSQRFEAYESNQWEVVRTSDTTTWFTPLSGADVATLKSDPERCKLGFATCRTTDAVFVPSGTVATLNAVYGSGTVPISWTEGATTYTVTWAGSFQSAVETP